MKIPIYWNGKQRGTFDDSTLEYFRDTRPEHFCKVFQGWGIQAEIVEELKRRDCQVVHLKYTNNDGEITDLYTDFSNYIEFGRRHEFNAYDGQQIFLSENEYFERITSNPSVDTSLDMY